MTAHVNTSARQDRHGTPPSLTDQAYEAIRDLIVTLQIRPGAPISEEQLMRRLGLGRTPIHQAIKRLESERLVAIFPRRGTFATEVNITDLALITEVRLQLEGHAAYSAAKRRTRAEQEELRRLLEEFDEPATTDADLMRLDTEVHRAIYRCTHNSYLEATLGSYYNLATRIWHLFLDRLPDVSEHIEQHRPLLEAIIAGHADQACDLACTHVSQFESTVRSAL
ncbi:GntR family transcriptional regulator [Streptomyces sioyaensis]|uniref:GntR family transcriptional regulator n=1 Tax=Streptomyces sioyaensis TaxID=67364 RepID=UPI0036CFAC1C